MELWVLLKAGAVNRGGSELWVCARPEDITSNTIGTGSSPW